MFSFYVNVKTQNGQYLNGSSLATMLSDAKELFDEVGVDIYGEVILMFDGNIYCSGLDAKPVIQEFILIKK